MPNTALTRMFGLRYPIIQAPMAGAAGGDLAREAAKGGGLGMIGTGSRASFPWLEAEWQRLGGTGPVGIGFMTWALDAREDQRQMLKQALELRPAAILLSFGDPGPYAPAIRAAGARLICQVQSAADVGAALAAGADLLVAQGTEAGGHTGRLPMAEVLGQVLAAAGSTPVAAAGGLATAADVAGVLARGACGAMLGTRFVATAECLYPDRAKERVVAASENDTVFTSVFDILQSIPWPPQYPGRALRNRFTDTWHGREQQLVSDLPAAQQEFEAARKTGDPEALVIYAGKAVGRISDVVPAAELMRQIGEGLG